jgi:P-type E1-E2 ATPase
MCESIIIFRSSPDEKAQTIKFVMKDKNALTLAVGDGANDVNMI